MNTHEHHDHTVGNAAVVAATGATVIAHHRAGASIAGVDSGVQAGDVIKVGHTVELGCLDTLVHRVITRHLLGQAGLKPDEADTGAGTLIQRFGSAANLMVQPQYPLCASD